MKHKFLIVFAAIFCIVGIYTTVINHNPDSASLPVQTDQEYQITNGNYHWEQIFSESTDGIHSVVFENVKGRISVSANKDSNNRDLTVESKIALVPNWLALKNKVLKAKEQFNVMVEKQDGVLKVTGLYPDELPTGISLGEIYIDITMPNDIAITAHIDEGHLKINDVKSDLNLTTHNGFITTNQCTGVISAVATGNDPGRGSITLNDVHVVKKARTINGSIKANFVSIPKDGILMQTHRGGISLSLPQNSSFDIQAKARQGNLLFERFLNRFDGDYESYQTAEGKVNGGGPLVNAVSENGMVSIKEVEKI